MRKNIIKKVMRHTKWLLSSVFDLVRFYKVVDKDFCIFISHNGDCAGGAPVVLYELVKSLKNDYKVILLCKKPGGILNQCNNMGILAYNIYLLQNLYIKIAIKRQVKFILVNTIASCDIIKKILVYTKEMPVYWWIHEEKNYLMKYRKMIPQKFPNNIRVLSVSNNVKNDLISLSPAFSRNNTVFFYGCTDLYNGLEKTENNTDVGNRYIISVIGRICERKNQLQVVKAYNLLSEEVRKNILLQFISASQDELYMKQLKQLCDGNKNISFIGPIKRENMKRIYEQSNLIICSSIDDPLPVVITEAMMLKCPFITSSCTGQYFLIQDGVNGFSYNVDSDKQLADKIESIINYCDTDLSRIMEEARKCYLSNFLPEIVKNKFIEMVIEG